MRNRPDANQTEQLKTPWRNDRSYAGAHVVAVGKERFLLALVDGIMIRTRIGHRNCCHVMPLCVV